MSARQSSPDASSEELERLRTRLDELEVENAQLRTQARLDDQLGADANRYRVIFANLGEGIVLQAADGQILACNAAAERILGLSVDQMAGRSSLDPRWQAIHEDGSPFPGDTHPAMVSLRTGEPLHAVIMGVHKPDGSLTWISINSQPLFESGDPRPHAVVTSFVDITTHKQSEARARDSEEKLRFALHAARMATWDWDLRTGEVRRSSNFARLLGLEIDALAPTYESFFDHVHPEDRNALHAMVSQAIARDGTGDEHDDDFIFEHRVLGSTGAQRWIAIVGRVLRGDDGAPIRMAGTIADISARKSLEDQLMLSQRMETVGRLAGGVAHDFNNLLMAILGCAEFAAMHDDLPAAVVDSLETIRDASEKAADLTRQLLSFARKQVFDLRVLDLRALLADTERLLSRIIGEDIEIVSELGDAEVLIRADRAQIEQVVVNLAVNARDAMPRGGRLEIELEIVDIDASAPGSLPPGRYALLELRDSGHGIPLSSLPHIFDPFFTTKDHGTGLGLATSYGIVKQLGGDIVVDSEPDHGTRFSIYLPLTDGALEAESEPHAKPKILAEGRILLAEDDPVVRMIAERGLQAHGYEVIAVPDGPTALARAAENPDIDLLVSDVIMPNMSGYELAERLRERMPGLKVLFVSGYTDGAFELDGPGHSIAGAVHLAKPYTGSRLAEVVGRMLID